MLSHKNTRQENTINPTRYGDPDSIDWSGNRRKLVAEVLKTECMITSRKDGQWESYINGERVGIFLTLDEAKVSVDLCFKEWLGL